jgi:hypothetical protein
VTAQSRHVILRLAAALAGAGLAANSAACAPVQAYNPDHLAPPQMERVGQICQQVMGLPVDNSSQYAACAEGLSNAVVARRQSGSMLAAREACEARGLKPETTALAECELQTSVQLVTTDFPDAAPAPSAQRVKSYYYASSAEINRREAEACVQVGDDPATSAFAECVAGLSQGLFDADHSIN